ncbi:MAG TPA: YcxB family protein [Xanthobacteraceae bacterium]|nr:YcxB family protein [Xanthobacteraceae bacterium]
MHRVLMTGKFFKFGAVGEVLVDSGLAKENCHVNQWQERRMENDKTPTEATYRVAYTEPMLRRAVWLFVWRGAMRPRGWLWLVAIALIGIGLAGGWSREPSWVLAVYIAAIALAPLYFLLVWRAHFVNTVGLFRSMASPTAEFVFRDQDVSISSELGSTTLPWTRFIDVWERPEFLMMFLTRSQFITLPVADLSEEALAFLRSRLPRKS